MTDVYIGVGSNIDPQNNLRRAVEMLQNEFPDLRLSSFYRTAARDFEEQDDFLNAVAQFQTQLSPDAILTKLQAIEHALHKDPPFKFGPRTIDLDMLLYGDLIIKQPHLTIPHPRMDQRRFVLEPLSELIDPQKKHPVLEQTWKELLSKTLAQQCKKQNEGLPLPRGARMKGGESEVPLSLLAGRSLGGGW